MNSLKNVVAVSRILASDIGSVVRGANGRAAIVNPGTWESLNIRVPAKLSLNNKVENKCIIWSAQLVFQTCDSLTTAGNWIYKVVLADDSILLIGSERRPYPVSSYSIIHPDNMSDSQMMEVSVKYESPENVLIIA